jgi:chromosome condensin MukBEF complex kleisin-like MukF subunit
MMSDPTDTTVVVVLKEDGTPEQITFGQLLKRMQLSITATEMVVSCGEKYQKRQFEPKDYFSSMKFTLADLYNLISRVQDPQQQIQARNAVAQIIRDQVLKSDTFQRETLRWIAQLDGIKPFPAADVTERRTNQQG